MSKMQFVRFGGLSPIKQTHYDTSKDKPFHNPPRKHGLYAFPYPYVEKYLLGATDDPTNISHKTQWLRDTDGNKVKCDDFYDYKSGYDLKLGDYPIVPKYVKLLKKLGIKQKDIWRTWDNKDECHYMTVMKKPRTFEYGGELWHHLGHHLKPHQILGISGSWTLSDMDDYLFALNREIHETRKQMLKSWSNFADMKDLMVKDPYKTMFAKDHLEVFIEQI